jgi:hypothetical protein
VDAELVRLTGVVSTLPLIRFGFKRGRDQKGETYLPSVAKSSFFIVKIKLMSTSFQTTGIGTKQHPTPKVLVYASIEDRLFFIFFFMQQMGEQFNMNHCSKVLDPQSHSPDSFKLS